MSEIEIPGHGVGPCCAPLVVVDDSSLLLWTVLDDSDGIRGALVVENEFLVYLT